MTQQEKELSAWYVIGTIILSGIIILCALCTKAHAQVFKPAFSDEQTIRAIIGEASNQGYDGMFAVSCALLNRNSLQGVYGAKARHIDKEPRFVWENARKAYYNAKEAYPGDGCQAFGTHWESVKFKEPYWAKSMVKLARVKDHQFYREK